MNGQIAFSKLGLHECFRGLCGNFNDDASDDLTHKNGSVGSISAIADFGQSWKVENSEPECQPGPQVRIRKKTACGPYDRV